MIFVVGFTIWLSALSLAGFGTWLARKHLKSLPPHLDAPFGLSPISILKPLKGVDSELERNLDSFFKLDYPLYELLFSVASPEDPAAAIAEKLIALHPDIPARLIVGDVNLGPNPKVNNIIRSYSVARCDYVLISDSNVRVEPDYLKRLMAHFENGVGIVTSIVAGIEARGFGGALESVFLNTFYARGMFLAQWAGKPCVIGKSMLFRKSTAERFGGMKALSSFLAEDYMAGYAMKRLGLRVVIASDPVNQVIGTYSFKSFWQRHLRWGRIRKAHAPLTFFFEPLSGTVISGLIGAVAFEQLFYVPALPFFLTHAMVCFALDLSVIRHLSRKDDFFEIFIAWCAREALAVIMWVAIASGRKVLWRGRKLVIQAGGTLAEIGT
jgi:ceramide glucosyltransferase